MERMQVRSLSAGPIYVRSTDVRVALIKPREWADCLQRVGLIPSRTTIHQSANGRQSRFEREKSSFESKLVIQLRPAGGIRLWPSEGWYAQVRLLFGRPRRSSIEGDAIPR